VMKKIFVFTVCIVMSITSIYAVFDDDGLSPKGKALGNAYYAEADGVTSLHYNPAGIIPMEAAIVQQLEIVPFIWGSPNLALDDSSMQNIGFSAVAPLPGSIVKLLPPALKNSGIGLQYQQFSLNHQANDFKWSEGSFTATFCKSFPRFTSPVNIGISVDVLNNGFVSENNDVTANTYISEKKASGVAIDVGAILQFPTFPIIYDILKSKKRNQSLLRMMQLGLVVDNIVNPNMSLNTDDKEKWQKNATRLRRNTKIGLAFKFISLGFITRPTLLFGISSQQKIKGDPELKGSTKTGDNQKANTQIRFGTDFAIEIAGGANSLSTLSIRLGYETGATGLRSFKPGLGYEYSVYGGHSMGVDLVMNTLSQIQGELGFSAAAFYKYSLPQSYFIQNKEERLEKKSVQQAEREEYRALRKGDTTGGRGHKAEKRSKTKVTESDLLDFSYMNQAAELERPEVIYPDDLTMKEGEYIELRDERNQKIEALALQYAALTETWSTEAKTETQNAQREIRQLQGDIDWNMKRYKKTTGEEQAQYGDVIMGYNTQQIEYADTANQFVNDIKVRIDALSEELRRKTADVNKAFDKDTKKLKSKEVREDLPESQPIISIDDAISQVAIPATIPVPEKLDVATGTKSEEVMTDDGISEDVSAAEIDTTGGDNAELIADHNHMVKGLSKDLAKDVSSVQKTLDKQQKAIDKLMKKYEKASPEDSGALVDEIKNINQQQITVAEGLNSRLAEARKTVQESYTATGNAADAVTADALPADIVVPEVISIEPKPQE